MWSGGSPVSANQTAQWLPLKVKCLFRAFEFCLFCILPFVVNLIIRSFYYYFHFYSKILLHSPFIVYDLVLFWAFFFHSILFCCARSLPTSAEQRSLFFIGPVVETRETPIWEHECSLWTIFFVLFVCAKSAQRGRGKKSWRFLLLLDSRIFLCHSSPLLCVFWSANVCSLARRRRPTHKTLPPLAVVARVLQSSGFNGTLCETTEECSASVDCVATTIDKRRARSHATTNERGAWIVAKFCILVMWTHGSTQKRQKKDDDDKPERVRMVVDQSCGSTFIQF